MNNGLFAVTGLVLLIPVLAYAFDRKMFYYSLLVIYPVVGQSIGTEVNVLGVVLNPSMIFGLLVLALTSLDFVLLPTEYPVLDALAILFIGYSLMISFFSPARMESISWTLKIATWLLLFLSSIKVFNSQKDLAHIHTATCIAVVVVLFSFLLSALGFYGDSFTYETGVRSYGGGFSSGKTLSYYLAFAIPVLATRLQEDDKMIVGISLILIFSSAIVILLTFVRAPVVALFLGYGAYQYVSIKYAGKHLGGVTVAIVLVVLVVAAATFFLGDSQVMSRWGELGSKYSEGKIDKLGSGRVGIFMSFVEHYFYKASMAQRILGTGLGSSVLYLGHDLIIHNDFAEILMGCGVFGFTFYLFIQIRVFSILISTLKKRRDTGYPPYGTLAIGCFIIFLAFHMTNLTSGVLMLSLWGIYTGATLGYGTKMTREAADSG